MLDFLFDIWFRIIVPIINPTLNTASNIPKNLTSKFNTSCIKITANVLIGAVTMFKIIDINKTNKIILISIIYLKPNFNSLKN